MLYNMSESMYVIYSYEGCKIYRGEYEERTDLNHNSEKYEGVKYIIDRVYRIILVAILLSNKIITQSTANSRGK